MMNRGALIVSLCLLFVAFIDQCHSIHESDVRVVNRLHKMRTSKPRPTLMVLVVAGGQKAVYSPFRATWRMVAAKLRPFGVIVHLIIRDVSVSKEHENGDTIYLPEEDDHPDVDEYTKWVLTSAECYAQMMTFAVRNKVAGSDAPYVLMTNLSSFWNFFKLLEWLHDKPQSNFAAGVIGRFQDGHQFLSGAGLMVSADVAELIVQKSHDINRTLPDDVAVSRLLRESGVPFQPMARCDDYAKLSEGGLKLDTVPISFSDQHYHWRVKADLDFQDVAIMSSLFFHHYGPSMGYNDSTNVSSNARHPLL